MFQPAPPKFFFIAALEEEFRPSRNGKVETMRYRDYKSRQNNDLQRYIISFSAARVRAAEEICT
jgi:hypothetical protein